MASDPLARILIVDDEVASLRSLCDILNDQGYDTKGVASGEQALGVLAEGSFDLLLTDLNMPGMDGVELLSAALKIDSQLAGILMTGMGTIKTAVEAMKAGALDYILKPFKVSDVLPVLARAMGVRRLRLENLELRNTVAIHELNQAIAHTLDAEILLKKIGDAAIGQFEADEASVMLLAEDGKTLYVAAVSGEGRETIIGSRLPVGEGIAGQVALHREPLMMQGKVNDVKLAPPYPRAEIVSGLSMPMITRGRLIGVLNVNFTRRTGTFTPGDIKALEIFTNAAAAGIEAARLYEAERRADTRFREVLQMAADAVVSLDSAYRVIMFNTAAERIFGWSATEIVGEPLELLIPERFAAAHRRHLAAFDAAPETTIPMQGRGPFFGRRKDGTEFPAEISISRLKENGSHIYTAVLRDITQRVQHEERIARLTRLYAVLSGVNAAIVRINDELALFSEICRVAVEGGGFMSAWVGTYDANAGNITVVTGTGPGTHQGTYRLDSGPEVQGLPALAILEKRVVWNNDLAAHPEIGLALRKDAIIHGARAGAALPVSVDNAVRAVMVLNSSAPDAFGKEERSLLRELAGDISFALDHIAKTRRVEHLATHDVLTGLPNRLLFLDRLAQLLDAAREKGKLVGVVLSDVERFRQINETFGKQAGDELLRQIARYFRAMPTTGPSLARVGADVFAAIFADIERPAEIAKFVRECNAKMIIGDFNIEGQTVRLAVRTGVALFPSDGKDAETLFHNAEAALKRAKGVQEQLVFYTPDLNARVAEQYTLETNLRRAIERKEFVLHYQPKVDATTRRTVGLEALIRWNDPETGLVLPMKFIPLLEETGLILQAGAWVMQEAARTAATLRANGLPSLRIAVNVSPIQLRQADFVRSVVEAIVAAGGGKHGLDLEITESVIMDDIDANVGKLAELRRMGVELSIDDFGTGYSSLAYMARLPVSVTKIDRAFIRSLTSDSISQSVVAAMISLTHGLNRIVVAEGVETEEQAELLRTMGCDQFQGFLFSKPVPVKEIESLLLSQAP